MRKKSSSETGSRFKRGRSVVAFVALCGLVIGIPLAIYFSRIPKAAAAAWFTGTGSEGSWSFRRKLIIDHGKVIGDADFTDFHIVINTTIADLKTYAQSDGDDIAFTGSDGKTQLAHEIETYDNTTGKITVWIEIPTLETEQDTIIYMYYGNPNASNKEGLASMWGGNFAAVYHMAEDPSISTDGDCKNIGKEICDSTPSNNDGDMNGSMTTGDLIDGRIGKAIDFDGSDDYIDIGNNSSLDVGTGDFSVIAWVNLSATEGLETFFAKSNGILENKSGFQFSYRGDLAGNYLQLRINDANAGGSQSNDNTTLDIGDNSWHFLSFTMDRDNGNTPSWLDGKYIDVSDIDNRTGTLTVANTATIANNSGGGSDPAQVKIDELWLMKQANSEDFSETLYNNQSSTTTFFRYFGDPETNPNPVSHWKFDEGANASCFQPSITLIDTATGTGTGTTVSIAKADLYGLQNNDLVVVALAHDENVGTGGSWTLAGWTFVSQKTTTTGHDGDSAIAYKIVSNVASEPATWDFAVSASGDKSASAIALRGVNTSSPVDATVVATDGINDATPNAPDITTASANAMIISALHLFEPDATINFFGGVPGELMQATSSNQSSTDTVYTAIGFALAPAAGTYSLGNWITEANNATTEHHENTIAFARTGTKTGDACDAMSETNHGTNSGATWQSASSCVMSSSCLLFDGSNDVVTVTNADSIDFDKGLNSAVSLSFWVNPSSGGENDADDLGEIIDKGSHFYCRTDSESGGYVDLECSIDLASGTDPTVNIAGALPLNTWSHVEVTFANDADDELNLYVNGQWRGKQAGSTGPVGTDTSDWLIGGDTSNNYHGYIDDFKIFAYERTAAQAKSDYLIGASSPGSGAALGGGLTPMPTPGTRWKFDDLSGTTAQDSGSGDNDLTLSSASWTRVGKFAGALNGTGGAIRASRADDADLQFAAADSFTLSAWVKSDSAGVPGATEYIMAQGATSAAGYAMYINTSGYACFAIDDDTDWSTPDTVSCTTTSVYDATWHHILGVRNVSADTLSIYIDGVMRDTDTDTTTATLDGNGVTYIGDMDADDAGTGEEFAGDIDEVHLYRSALTDAQIKIDYNAQAAINLGRGVNERLEVDVSPTPQPDYATNLIGYWPMDENVDNTCTGGTNDVCDRTASGNNGASSGSPTWIPGKYGSGLNFSDASNQYVNIGDVLNITDSQDFSASGWFYWVKGTAHDTVIAKYNNVGWRFYISVSNDKAIFEVDDGPDAVTVTSSPTITQNRWYHFAIVYDDSSDAGTGIWLNGQKVATATGVSAINDLTNTGNLRLGAINAGASFDYFNGRLDDIKYFSSALTPAQIAYEYSRGKPLAWYRFDECSGATANDAAEVIPLPTQRPNGTITIGGTGTYTSTGTCSSGTSTHAWYGGAIGKVGAGLGLDGTNDYIATANTALLVPNSSTYTNISWGAWVKPTNSSASKTIIHKNNEFRLTTNSSSQPVCEIYASSWQTGATNVSALTLDTWSHVFCVYNGAQIKVYVNGVESSPAQTETDAITSSSATALNLGRDSGGSGYFEGVIDDVKVYNFPLSSAQVKQTQMNGSVKFE